MKLKYFLFISIFFALISISSAQTVQPDTNPQTTQQQPAIQAPEITQTALETQWFGVSSGFPLGLNLHYGLNDIIVTNLDLRANGTFFAGSLSPLQTVLGLGLDGLYNLDNPDSPNLAVYLGGGLGAVVLLGKINGNFGLDVHGLAGAEYRFGGYGVFGEVNVGTGFASTYALGAALRIGFNYHFQ